MPLTHPLSDAADAHARRPGRGAPIACACGEFSGNELAWRDHREQKIGDAVIVMLDQALGS